MQLLAAGLLAAVMGIVSGVAVGAPAVVEVRPAASSAADLVVAPSPLLAIDQNRSTVVERIVATWGDAFAESNAGLDAAQLRTMLAGMRADHLLAASLVGNLDGLRNVVAGALVSTADVRTAMVQAKGVQLPTTDLVYTPVLPCRLADTRVAGGPIAANSTRDFKVWVSSGGFTAQGGDAGNCNIPADPVAVALNLTVVNPGGLGNLIAYPTGGALPNTSTLNFQANTVVLANGAIIPTCTAGCPNQLSVKANGPSTDLVIDIVGYFRSPLSGYVTAVGLGTGIAIGGTATNPTVGIANGGVGSTQIAAGAVTQVKLSAAGGTVGKVLGTDGTNLQWQTPAAGGVTGILTTAPITGGPITTSGTIGLGTVPVANGGTGQTTLTNNGVLIGQGSAAVTAVAGGGVGTVLAGTGAAPAFTNSPVVSGPITSTSTNLLSSTQGVGILNAGAVGASHVAIDGDDIMRFTGNTPGTLFLNYYGGDVNLSGGNLNPANRVSAYGKGVVVGQAEDNLRIIRGWGNAAATPIGVVNPPFLGNGAGFTYTKIATGVVDVTFTTPFTGNPAVTANVIFAGAIFIQLEGLGGGGDIDKAGFRAVMWDTAGVKQDWPFNFIAIGPL